MYSYKQFSPFYSLELQPSQSGLEESDQLPLKFCAEFELRVIDGNQFMTMTDVLKLFNKYSDTKLDRWGFAHDYICGVFITKMDSVFSFDFIY